MRQAERATPPATEPLESGELIRGHDPRVPALSGSPLGAGDAERGIRRSLGIAGVFPAGTTGRDKPPRESGWENPVYLGKPPYHTPSARRFDYH
jgi:hypothetical protein